MTDPTHIDTSLAHPDEIVQFAGLSGVDPPEAKLPDRSRWCKTNWGALQWKQDVPQSVTRIEDIRPVESCETCSNGRIAAVINQKGTVRLIDREGNVAFEFSYDPAYAQADKYHPVSVAPPRLIDTGKHLSLLIPRGESGTLFLTSFPDLELRACVLPAVDVELDRSPVRTSVAAVTSIQETQRAGQEILVLSSNMIPYMFFDKHAFIAGMKAVEADKPHQCFPAAQGLIRHATKLHKYGIREVAPLLLEKDEEFTEGIIYGVVNSGRESSESGHSIEREYPPHTHTTRLLDNAPEARVLISSGREIDRDFLYMGGEGNGYVAKMGLLSDQPEWAVSAHEAHCVEKLELAYCPQIGKVVVGIDNLGKLFILDDQDGRVHFFVFPEDAFDFLNISREVDFKWGHFQGEANFFIGFDNSGERSIFYVLNPRNPIEKTHIIKISLNTLEACEMHSPIDDVWDAPLPGETIASMTQSFSDETDGNRLITCFGTNYGRVVAYKAPLHRMNGLVSDEPNE